MATRSVTVRLDEQTIDTIDRLIEPMAQQLRTGGWIPIARKPTRSDMIRAFVTGYLMDHHVTVDKILSSQEGS